MSFTKNQNILIFTLLVALAGTLSYLFLLPQDNSYQRGALIDRFDTVATTAEEDYRPILVPLGSDEAVSLASSLKGEEVLYYEVSTGRTYSFDPKTRTREVVSENILEGFERSIWSPARKEVISLFTTRQGQEYRYYDFESKISTTLPKGISSVVFSPDGSRIAYFLQKEGGDNQIMVSRPDGSLPKEILKTRIPSLNISWPKEEMLSLQYKKEGGEGGLYTLTLSGNLEKKLSGAPSLSVLWSPSAEQLLYSTEDPSGATSFYIMRGQETKKINIEASSELCAWNNNEENIFCLVSSRESAGEVALSSLDAKTLETTVIRPRLDVRPKEVLLTRLNGYLIILDRHNQLYAAPLN